MYNLVPFPLDLQCGATSVNTPKGDYLSPLIFILSVNSIYKWITTTKFLFIADV